MVLSALSCRLREMVWMRSSSIRISALNVSAAVTTVPLLIRVVLMGSSPDRRVFVPSLDGDFGVGIEQDAAASVGLGIAEKRVLGSAEREKSHGCWNPN